MKIRLKTSKRYPGYQIEIDPEQELFTVEDAKGKQVARMILEDSLYHLGVPPPDFNRQYPRLKLGIQVKYYDPQGRFHNGTTSMIGGGGLFIEHLDPLPKGTEIDLELHLPVLSKGISARAKVVWVRKSLKHKVLNSGMGLEFIRISDQDRGELMRFIHQFSPQREVRES
jgi:uncharacterized protein (TIGR02266 family)